MAPTEILADQHAKNISAMMKKLYEVIPGGKLKFLCFLVVKKNPKERNDFRRLNYRKLIIIVGTHALFEEKVNYKNLGLVVIDEQHRFGVRQRARLQSKGNTPEVLVMSATPIPRTISMTIYGDLDISVIDEMPRTGNL